MNATLAYSPRKTILIVDDMPANLGVIFDTLRGQGFKTLVSTDGELAIQRAEQSLPCLILLDVIMPGMDGFEICRRLKANDNTKDIPVIFLTSLGQEESFEGFEAGGVDYITKPIRPKDVLARVNTHLRIHELTEELQQANQALLDVNSELKDFAHVISHDLKAPLRGAAWSSSG